jgi:chromosome partitioning protein
VARITTIINQKGGVAKTTTALSLTSGLLLKGHSVLLVDADPQANTSLTMSNDAYPTGLYECLCGKSTVMETTYHTQQGDILPSTILLAAADMEFTGVGREWLLDSVLKPVKDKYDFIIIDTPPTLGILSVNALTACNDVIIPMHTDIYSLQGLSQLCDTINKVKQFCNHNITIAGILITRYNGRAIINREFRESIAEKVSEINASLYNTIIRESIAVKEAQTSKISLFEYAPQSNPALDYMQFIDEYLNQKKDGIR